MDAAEKPDLAKLVAEWHALTGQIATVKSQLEPLTDQEKRLRLLISQAAFPDEQEGTLWYMGLPEKWRLKIVLKLDRQVDEAALDAVRKQFTELKIPIDNYLNIKHTLALAEYRTLTAEQKTVFDQALVVKASLPTIELLPPKEPK